MVLIQGIETAKDLLKTNSEIAYSNFYNSIRAEQSKIKYAYCFDKYIEYVDIKGGRNEVSLLLDENVRNIDNKIISYIIKLRNEDYSFNTITTRLAAIYHFYTMNDVLVNRKKIGKYLGENKKTIKDRAYTIQEIKRIVDACSLKYKIIVTMMASSGCRIGAISSIKVAHLKYITKEKMYQIFFYANAIEEYFSFCSPECAKYIMEYLEYRERCGEKITAESPLIRDDFIQDDLLHIEHPKHNSTATFEFYLRNILIKTGIRKPIPQEYRGGKKKTRKEISANHGFRKFCHTTMANNKVQPEIREMLLGHSIGLSDSYYKPTEREMLLEYLKVVNALTINEENRLKRENQILKNKLETDFALFATKLAEVEKKIGID